MLSQVDKIDIRNSNNAMNVSGNMIEWLHLTIPRLSSRYMHQTSQAVRVRRLYLYLFVSLHQEGLVLKPSYGTYNCPRFRWVKVSCLIIESSQQLNQLSGQARLYTWLGGHS